MADKDLLVLNSNGTVKCRKDFPTFLSEEGGRNTSLTLNMGTGVLTLTDSKGDTVTWQARELLNFAFVPACP